MKNFFLRLTRLIFGLFLYALGIVLCINANIGYAPWEVFHVGLAKTLGLSIGTISISVGLILVALVALLKEKIGMGMILNMLLIGVFLDLIMALNVLPVANHLAVGCAMLIAGLIIIAFGSYFYIGSAFGAGPRDSLMVALTRLTKLPVGVCRFGIEFIVLAGGWLLGGMVGVGTIISVVLIGFCIQYTFKLMKFDPTKVKHEMLAETFRRFFRKKQAEENAGDEE